MSQLQNRQYCSIDLEFTGFNPDEDQILEIGFAFFSISPDGIKIGEQWSQVFKPTIPVHEKIYGLTGITPEELETAPSISEFKQFLSEKLSKVTLLAHNPTLDVKFLEAAGVTLSGNTIDSLELVQFMLPTHHSYNLENLTHYFDIKHTGSHRALSDCLATIGLVENLLGLYNQFDESLKVKLYSIMEQGQFVWTELFAIPFPSKPIKQIDSINSLAQKDLPQLDILEINNKPLVIDRAHHNHEARVLNSILSLDDDQKWLLALPSKKSVMDLWNAKLAKALFKRDDVFDRDKFDYFLEQAETSEQLRFCLKIMVWLETNWQTSSVLDLNLSFFGGQFKQFVTGGEQLLETEKIILCDFDTLDVVADNQQFQDRKLFVVDMQQFENYLTHGSKTRISWNGINYSIKSIYNPETGFGDLALSERVVSALSSVDLFFGLIQIILRKETRSIYIDVTKLKYISPYFYNRLVKASENLLEKLDQLVELSSDSYLATKVELLRSFFVDQAGIAKWLSLQEENTILHSQPVIISDQTKAVHSNFVSTQYSETLIKKGALFYLADRLGLNSELSDIQPYLADHMLKLDSYKAAYSSTLFEHVNSIDGSHVVVFDKPAEIKSFYKEYYQELKKSRAVFAQEYSGSGNKMFRNFSMFPQVVLMMTADFIAKQKYVIDPKVITFLSEPKFDSDHPYNMFLAEHYPETHHNLSENYSDLKTIQVLKKLFGPSLQKIYGLKNEE